MLTTIVATVSCDSGFGDECHRQVVVTLRHDDEDSHEPAFIRINSRLHARDWRLAVRGQHECPACVRVRTARWALQYAGVVEAMQ